MTAFQFLIRTLAIPKTHSAQLWCRELNLNKYHIQKTICTQHSQILEFHIQIAWQPYVIVNNNNKPLRRQYRMSLRQLEQILFSTVPIDNLQSVRRGQFIMYNFPEQTLPT